MLVERSDLFAAGQDKVQDDARDCREGHAAEGDGAKGDSSAADAQNEDGRGDAEVAGLAEINMMVDQGTDTGRGDHAVQQDAYAAQNCLRNGTAQSVELGAEGQQRHPDGAEELDSVSEEVVCVFNLNSKITYLKVI